ncbi:hypothetical protein M514_26943 [Trichuris suis]|uniref:Uncharacterized protein n=1 Tax=Trichuris suis TaxID=68888 RepID=A0A085MUI6_9BILA|nr:hypothetical protein M514_26943 [Trichuris suis]
MIAKSGKPHTIGEQLLLPAMSEVLPLKNGRDYQAFFSFESNQSSDGLRASYNLSLMIAKSGKPHTIGEQLLLE